MAKGYDKEALILDWRTGDYTTRKLGEKYGISHVMVTRLVKDTPKDLEPVIKRKTEIMAKVTSELAELPLVTEKELTVIDESVSYKLTLMQKIKSFTTAAMESAERIAMHPENGTELKAVADAVDKMAMTNGLVDRHAKAPTTNIVTNNNLVNMSLDELDREIKELERVL